MRQPRIILIGNGRIIICDREKFHVIFNGTRVTYKNGKIIEVNAYQGKIPVGKDDVIFKLSNKGLVRIPIPQWISTDGGIQK